MTDHTESNRQAIKDYEMATKFDPKVHCSGIFERLERFTPEQRAHLFYALEGRWCWDCGYPQGDPAHEECPSAEIEALRSRCSVLERERDAYAFDQDVMRFALNVPKDMALADYVRDRLIPELSSLRSKYEEARVALGGLLERPPTFRAFTEGDWRTCGYCHEPIESPIFGHDHSDTCVWANAKRAQLDASLSGSPYGKEKGE